MYSLLMNYSIDNIKVQLLLFDLQMYLYQKYVKIDYRTLWRVLDSVYILNQLYQQQVYNYYSYYIYMLCG